VKGGGGGNTSSERKENLRGIKSFALFKVFLSRLKESLRTGIGGFFGAGLVTPLTFRLLRLCEFVRNFSTLEVTAGNERTVKVELSRDEQMSSNNCDSSVGASCENAVIGSDSRVHWSVDKATSREVVDGWEEVDDTDRPESGDVSLDDDVLLGGGGGGRSLRVP